MSQAFLRCSLGKVASLTLLGTALAFLTAGMVSAQVVKDKEPGKEEQFETPRGKKGSLIVAGYTRPGTPNDTFKDGKVIPVAWDDDYKGRILGGSVYFAVYEQTGFETDTGDVFGTGMVGIDNLFREGRSTDGTYSRMFDTRAKYLYLYMVVNDRGLDPPKGKVLPAAFRNFRTEDIITATVKLLVDPREITSWGYFENLAFASKVPDRTIKGDIVLAKDGMTESPIRLAISSNPAILSALPNQEYGSISPAFLLSKLQNAFGLDKSNLNFKTAKAYNDLVKLQNDKIELVAWQKNMIKAAAGGMQPDYVQIVPAEGQPYGKVGVDAFGNVIDVESLPAGQNPARAYLRVDWGGDQVIKLGEHSVVFGFTSNLPPIDEVVRVVSAPDKNGKVGTGVSSVALVDGDDPGVGDAQVVASGTVPTPIPAAAGGIGGVGGIGTWMGGFPLVGSLGGGGIGGVGAGFIGTPRAGTIGGGATSGGGGTPSGQQGQTPTQTQSQGNSTNTGGGSNQTINFSPTLINQQTQFQQQQQQQKQQQSQPNNNNCYQGQVVPEPAAIALGLLGLPALFLALRRRKATLSSVQA
jgi:hypothetical protein